MKLTYGDLARRWELTKRLRRAQHAYSKRPGEGGHHGDCIRVGEVIDDLIREEGVQLPVEPPQPRLFPSPRKGGR